MNVLSAFELRAGLRQSRRPDPGRDSGGGAGGVRCKYEVRALVRRMTTRPCPLVNDILQPLFADFKKNASVIHFCSFVDPFVSFGFS